MRWVSLVIGVVVIAYFGRFATPAGAAEQAAANRRRAGWAAKSPEVVLPLALAFVALGVFLVVGALVES